MTYTLPAAVRERLHAALQGRRNRDACMVLATFLARFWSSPRKLGQAFPCDRRALAPVGALGLTEARIRGALKALEVVGFLTQASASTYRRTADGPRRKASLYSFAPAYRAIFDHANARACASYARRSAARSWQNVAQAPARLRPSPALSGNTKEPIRNTAKLSMLTGEQRARSATVEPSPRLEAALDRWRRVFEKERSRSA